MSLRDYVHLNEDALGTWWAEEGSQAVYDGEDDYDDYYDGEDDDG